MKNEDRISLKRSLGFTILNSLIGSSMLILTIWDSEEPMRYLDRIKLAWACHASSFALLSFYILGLIYNDPPKKSD
jgi:hypothetical protein